MPSHWRLDAAAFPHIECLTREVRKGLFGGIWYDREIQFCIELAGGDVDLARRNFRDARSISDVPFAPMLNHIRESPLRREGTQGQSLHHGVGVSVGTDTSSRTKAAVGSAVNGGSSSSEMRNRKTTEETAESWRMLQSDLSTKDSSNAISSTGLRVEVHNWVPWDDMDRGVVYRAKNPQDGFLARTHEDLIGNPCAGDALLSCKKKLDAEELIMKALHMKVPSRTGYQARAYKRKELRKSMGRKTNVDLGPVDNVPSTAPRGGPQGNVSYNGHTNIAWQRNAVSRGSAICQSSVAALASLDATPKMTNDIQMFKKSVKVSKQSLSSHETMELVSKNMIMPLSGTSIKEFQQPLLSGEAMKEVGEKRKTDSTSSTTTFDESQALLSSQETTKMVSKKTIDTAPSSETSVNEVQQSLPAERLTVASSNKTDTTPSLPSEDATDLLGKTSHAKNRKRKDANHQSDGIMEQDVLMSGFREKTKNCRVIDDSELRLPSTTSVPACLKPKSLLKKLDSSAASEAESRRKPSTAIPATVSRDFSAQIESAEKELPCKWTNCSNTYDAIELLHVRCVASNFGNRPLT